MERLGPFLIPIVALLIPIVAIVAGAVSQIHSNRLKADQRMAMLARGIPLAEVEAVLGADSASDPGNTLRDPMRSIANARRAAIVLISTGVGVIFFFNLVSAILGVREVLAGAAAGAIPLFIGIGFVVDYHLQKRELSRFGLQVGADPRE